MPGFRKVIGALLWLCLTHVEPMCEVLLLQQEVTRAMVTSKHALAANALLERVKRYGEGIGLHFLPLTSPFCQVGTHDACGTTKMSSYAQQGHLAVIQEDHQIMLAIVPGGRLPTGPLGPSVLRRSELTTWHTALCMRS